MNQSLLIVEDDEALREQLCRRLTQQGFTVSTAATVEQALAIIATLTALDAALLDQNIDADNGLDLIAPIAEKFVRCRIVMHTGYGSIPAAVAATKRGAADYLTKPATLEHITLALLGREDSQQAPALPSAPPSLERLEWEHIQRVLNSHDGNVSAAARTLGIHRRTLQRRLKKRPSASEYERDRPPLNDSEN